jgi:hypothetical protein
MWYIFVGIDNYCRGHSSSQAIKAGSLARSHSNVSTLHHIILMRVVKSTKTNLKVLACTQSFEFQNQVFLISAQNTVYLKFHFTFEMQLGNA